MCVIVKGMRLPDCCAVCELTDSDDDGVYCNVLEEFMHFDELPEGRRSDCPLEEVPRCKDCFVDGFCEKSVSQQRRFGYCNWETQKVTK
jgi:hypothetical protein